MWEDNAAQHVSIGAELAGIAGLATRWRRLELASWRGTLARVAAAHAAGARHSWFHLYQLLLLPGGGAGSGASGGAGEAAGGVVGADAAEQEVPWWQLGKAGAGGRGGGAGAGGADGAGAGEGWYSRCASAMEAFLQTSTVGEFEARLRLLDSFRAHLLVGLTRTHTHVCTHAYTHSGGHGGSCERCAAHRAATAQLLASQPHHHRAPRPTPPLSQVRCRLLASPATPPPSGPPPAAPPHADAPPSEAQRCHAMAAALANTSAYYAQFVPAVRASLASGMAPHEKDLVRACGACMWRVHVARACDGCVWRVCAVLLEATMGSTRFVPAP